MPFRGDEWVPTAPVPMLRSSPDASNRVHVPNGIEVRIAEGSASSEPCGVVFGDSCHMRVRPRNLCFLSPLAGPIQWKRYNSSQKSAMGEGWP